MARQQITFSLNATQVKAALEQYAATMFDPAVYTLAAESSGTAYRIVATRKRVRKAKAPKVTAGITTPTQRAAAIS